MTHLTLVPRPVHTPVEIFQPITSPATLVYAARAGHRGVFALGGRAYVKGNWDRFAEEAAVAGRVLGPGEGRCLQLIVHVAPTSAEAVRVAGPSLDEHVRFLSQYGRFRNIEPGAPFDFAPTVDDARRTGAMAIGSVEEVTDLLGQWREALNLQHVALFVDLPGLTRQQVDQQLQLLATEVWPRLGVQLGAELGGEVGG